MLVQHQVSLRFRLIIVCLIKDWKGLLLRWRMNSQNEWITSIAFYLIRKFFYPNPAKDISSWVLFRSRFHSNGSEGPFIRLVPKTYFKKFPSLAPLEKARPFQNIMKDLNFLFKLSYFALRSFKLFVKVFRGKDEELGRRVRAYNCEKTKRKDAEKSEFKFKRSFFPDSKSLEAFSNICR